jgi:hypothetical protein
VDSWDSARDWNSGDGFTDGDALEIAEDETLVEMLAEIEQENNWMTTVIGLNSDRLSNGHGPLYKRQWQISSEQSRGR